MIPLENIFFSFPLLLASGMKDVQAYARKKGIETGAAFTESIFVWLPEEESTAKNYPVARSFVLRCLLFPLYLVWLPLLGLFVMPLAFLGLPLAALGWDALARGTLFLATLPCEGLT